MTQFYIYNDNLIDVLFETLEKTGNNQMFQLVCLDILENILEVEYSVFYLDEQFIVKERILQNGKFAQTLIDLADSSYQ